MIKFLIFYQGKKMDSFLKSEDLNLLQEYYIKLTDRIEFIKKEREIQKITQAVETKGWYCSNSFHDEILGLNMIQLPLFVSIYTWNKDDKYDLDNLHIGHILKDQRSWVEILNYDISDPVLFTTNHKCNINNISDDWEGDDLDDPITSTGAFDINVYYKNPDNLPKENFKVIDENGEIREIHQKDDILFFENDEDCIEVSNWKDGNFIILPEKY